MGQTRQCGRALTCISVDLHEFGDELLVVGANRPRASSCCHCEVVQPRILQGWRVRRNKIIWHYSQSEQTFWKSEDVGLVKFMYLIMYLVFTHVPGESKRRLFRSLFLLWSHFLLLLLLLGAFFCLLIWNNRIKPNSIYSSIRRKYVRLHITQKK